MEVELRRKLAARLRPLVGVALSIVAAVSLGYAFAGRDVRIVLPLWFVVILFLLALRYGMAVGVVGSLLSAVIFACMLFHPLGSWRIDDQAARQNLAWMILAAVALSLLFAPSSSKPKQPEK
jgi:K+-sensing histidine kinase KdpD